MKLESIPRIGAQQPVGYVTEGTVEAHNLVATDEEFVAAAEALENATEIGALCQQTFNLGVLIRRQATPNVALLSFSERVQRFDEDVQRVTHEAVQALTAEADRIANPDQGVLNEAVNRQLGFLSEAIDRAFDENDKKSALHRVEQAVRKAATEANEQASRSLRDLLSVSTGRGPLAELRETMVREVSAPFAGLSDSLKEVEKLLAAEIARRDEHQRGTQQGIEFEEAVAEELGKLCQITDDILIHTGNEPAAGGNKVGDYVIEIHTNRGAQVKMVFECKKRSTPLSVAKMRDELSTAAKNRDTAVAVMVLSGDGSATHHMPLLKLAEHRYVVVYDDLTRDAMALRLAFQQARSDALATLVTTGDGEGIDLDALVAKLAEARSLLSHLKQIQSGVRAGAKALSAIQDNAVTMQTKLLGCMDDCDQLVKLT
ncbi:hypothetical protein [Mycolicibacterium psychrotolerans]|uniref:Uncharacterized protein n=1 Tax=Mycolicibacterium psychrotolerans TaxID=216929 RepID=A0A7I7MB14_9MYCO|nr:hypothetical protein [Mycolicibacterium psychrotolerans]BBX69246.1 hypothetical protein MPSYJ_27070 [Mycolicibacterium psychrotolerans]